jgi:hypothetical protein
MKNKLPFLALLFIFVISFGSLAQNPINKTIQITTTVQKTPPSITFSWNVVSGANSFTIYRKGKEAKTWGKVRATLAGSATSYTDTNVTVGIGYEYKIYQVGADTATTYVYAGIELPVTEARGKMILLVDSTMIDSLSEELHQLQNDLIGDGWTVIRKNVGRNDTVPAVKKIINDIYFSDPVKVKSLFIFGHVPIPYAGDINPDGHPNHLGAWPCDMYYGDMDSLWTDSIVDTTVAAWQINWNVPHDGKWDQSVLYQMSDSVTLETGRVDLWNLPSFPQTETQLLKQYLAKDHNYKFKLINPLRQGFIADNFGSYNLEYFASTGWRNFSALFNDTAVFQNDTGYFTEMTTRSFLFSYGCGGGTFTSASGIGSTSNFVSDSIQSVFTMLFGSYFGDWNGQDDFLRAPLASKGCTLTDCWAGRPYWNFHHMGLGETTGYCAKLSQNSNGSLYIVDPIYPWLDQMIHIALMGDPSLRLHIVAPPSALIVRQNVTVANLSWTAAPAWDSSFGYYIYRLDSATQVYNRISPSVITSLNFTDSFPTNGNNYYMVRALKLEKAASGTYYNLSEGVFDTANIVLNGIAQLPNPSINILVFPNPAKEMVNIQFKLSSGEHVRLVLSDMLGQDILEPLNKSMSTGQHSLSIDVSHLSAGMYYLRLDEGNGMFSNKKVIIER